MQLEKNQLTRGLYKRLLAMDDKILGKAFPKMKRVSQVTTSHCGPAVLVELFSFLGFSTSQSAVVKTLRAQKKIRRYGLNVNDLARAVKFLGKKEYVFWKKANATLGNVNTVINKYKHPVGVEWQGVFYEFADEDDGHYSVVTRMDRDKGYLRMADSFRPFAGIDRKFSLNFFEKRWWDFNEIKSSRSSKTKKVIDRKMMFVITKRGETWPKNLGMKKKE